MRICSQKAGEVRFRVNPVLDGEPELVPINTFNSVTVWEPANAIFPRDYFGYTKLVELPDAPFAAASSTFWQSMTHRDISDKVSRIVELIRKFGIPWFDRYSTLDALVQGLLN